MISSWIWCGNNFIIFKRKHTCAGVEMLGAGTVPVVELAGGLSLELRARFRSCV